MTQTTMIAMPSRSLAGRLWLQVRASLRILAIDAIAAQRLARERDSLASLSDAALKDLGLTRADIEDELRKPVWRR